jgi:hypothetical protein
MILAIYLFVIKLYFIFSNGNLTLKSLVKPESFQHYYVFVTLLNNVFVEGVNIYINLAFEVRVNFTENKLI